MAYNNRKKLYKIQYTDSGVQLIIQFIKSLFFGVLVMRGFRERERARKKYGNKGLLLEDHWNSDWHQLIGKIDSYSNFTARLLGSAREAMFFSFIWFHMKWIHSYNNTESLSNHAMNNRIEKSEQVINPFLWWRIVNGFHISRHRKHMLSAINIHRAISIYASHVFLYHSNGILHPFALANAMQNMSIKAWICSLHKL